MLGVFFFKCLNCPRMSLAVTYLEINIGSNLKRTNYWKFIIDKINSRKGKCLHLLIGFV